jgi:hypothetical protein
MSLNNDESSLFQPPTKKTKTGIDFNRLNEEDDIKMDEVGEEEDEDKPKTSIDFRALSGGVILEDGSESDEDEDDEVVFPPNAIFVELNDNNNEEVATSCIDFNTLNDEVFEDTSQESFEKKSTSRQYAIKQEIKNKLNELFIQHRMDNVGDCVEFLSYFEKSLNGAVRTSHNSAILDQLSTLNLSQRTHLIRLLSHTNGAPNEAILDIFPAMRERSTHLASFVDRKVREDKIDLQFVSDFMHDYCR